MEQTAPQGVIVLEDTSRQTSDSPVTAEISGAAPSKPRHDWRTAFMAERKLLLDKAWAASDGYSKAVLTLAGGFLAVSVTFIKEIAPHPQQGSAQYLKLGW